MMKENNTEMELVLINSSINPLMDMVEHTYTSSFPEDERRDFHLVKELVDNNKYFALHALLSKGVYVGFITSWEFDGFRFAEHFAIDESARNGGYGAKSLNLLISSSRKPVVLEVELPHDEMSRRRIGFYERLGFVLDGHVYYQLPYRDTDSPIEMRLMSYGDIDLDKSFDDVKKVVYKNIYGVVES